MEEKVKEIISNTLGVDLELINENTINSDFKQWDSLRQINLVVALEQEFGIQFSEEDILELISFKLIVNAIKEKL